MLTFNIITIFPNIFESYFKESIIKRAQQNGFINIAIHNLRDYTVDRHKTVDDKPFGGGPGMVMMVGPIFKAVSALKKQKSPAPEGRGSPRLKSGRQKVILFSARGRKFDQQMAQRFSKLDELVMICGRYEGVDERVAKHIADMEVSVGGYMLTGGELPAMIVVDAVSRLVPGVIKEESIEEKRFKISGQSSVASEQGRIGSYPAYTRPEIFSPKKRVLWKVPGVLISGDHKKIEEWRQEV